MRIFLQGYAAHWSRDKYRYPVTSHAYVLCTAHYSRSATAGSPLHKDSTDSSTYTRRRWILPKKEIYGGMTAMSRIDISTPSSTCPHYPPSRTVSHPLSSTTAQPDPSPRNTETNEIKRIQLLPQPALFTQTLHTTKLSTEIKLNHNLILNPKPKPKPKHLPICRV